MVRSCQLASRVLAVSWMPLVQIFMAAFFWRIYIYSKHLEARTSDSFLISRGMVSDKQIIQNGVIFRCGIYHQAKNKWLLGNSHFFGWHGEEFFHIFLMIVHQLIFGYSVTWLKDQFCALVACTDFPEDIHPLVVPHELCSDHWWHTSLFSMAETWMIEDSPLYDFSSELFSLTRTCVCMHAYIYIYIYILVYISIYHLAI